MSVAVEVTAIAGGDGIRDLEVLHQLGVHVLLALGGLHHLAESLPVGQCPDSERAVDACGDAVVGIHAVVYLQRHAFGLCPRGTLEYQMCALRLVGCVCTGSVVHGVVAGQSQFVAREQLACIAVEGGQVERTVPQACL